MLKEVLHAISEMTGLDIRPVANYNKNSLSYTWYNLLDNGATAQDRLEIKLIADSIGALEEYTAKIKQAVLGIGDESPFIGFSLSMDGGGSMYDQDAEKYIQSLYFTITKKTEVI